jgi:hypothetical protein
VYSPDDKGEGLKKSGNTRVSGIKAAPTDLFSGTQITVLKEKMSGKNVSRVYRPDVFGCFSEASV